jgi:hypothetical protein
VTVADGRAMSSEQKLTVPERTPRDGETIEPEAKKLSELVIAKRKQIDIYRAVIEDLRTQLDAAFRDLVFGGNNGDRSYQIRMLEIGLLQTHRQLETTVKELDAALRKRRQIHG